MPCRLSPAFRSTCLVAALLVAMIILYQSTQERGQPGVPDLTTNEAYLAHFAIYATLTFLGLVALAPRSVPAFLTAVLMAISLGVAMELYQAQTATRASTFEDVMANTGGVILGAFIFLTLVAFTEPPRSRQSTKY